MWKSKVNRKLVVIWKIILHFSNIYQVRIPVLNDAFRIENLTSSKNIQKDIKAMSKIFDKFCPTDPGEIIFKTSLEESTF